MDRLGLAGVPSCRYRYPASYGRGADLSRRYALFTLVGIAGEDDLDAPDLITTPFASFPQETKTSGQSGRHSARHRAPARATGPATRESELSQALSASLTDELLREIAELTSVDAATQWAQRRLSAKNRLSVTDAQRVEAAFVAQLASDAVSTREAKDATVPANHGSAIAATDAPQVDKSVLPFPEPRRIRDRQHVRYVSKQPCLICGRLPSDPHHLRFAQLRALGRKASDEFTVPLCRAHHREVHRCGDEAVCWQKSGIDPLAAARTLWLETHPLPTSKSNETGGADPDTGGGHASQNR
jgi:hypothetical protein